MKSSPLPLVLVGAGLLMADKVFGFFAPDEPGGNVTPGTGDDRPATLNEAEARALADRIYSDFWPGGLIALPYENDEDAGAALMVCAVTADVRLVMNAYGDRGTVLSPMNLAETVATYLDNDVRQVVNADYMAKGIAIRF